MGGFSRSSSSSRRPLQRRVVRASDGPEPQQQPDSTSSSSSSSSQPQLSLGNPAETIVWGGRQPSSRRAALGLTTAIAIALGGNLGGITSFLFGLDGGQLAGRLHADVLVPVGGFKRCVDGGYGYEFQYPAAWLADQTLAARQAQRGEAARSLDPQPITPRRREVVEPAAAFGPPGSTGEENVSVIVAPIYVGFKLEGLGTPQAAAETFLTTIVAPPGSDKTAALVEAGSRRDESGCLYYQFEFTVAGPRFDRHNVAVLASRDNLLYTLNVQCPASRWQEDGLQLRRSAESFRLSASRVLQQYPGRLQ